jgi:hypothetical protein
VTAAAWVRARLIVIFARLNARCAPSGVNPALQWRTWHSCWFQRPRPVVASSSI